MTHTRTTLFVTTTVTLVLVTAFFGAEKVDVASSVKTIRAVGPNGAGHREAIAAVRELSQADASQLPEILAGMDGADVLATNWLRAAAETVAQRQLERGKKLPVDALEAFLDDTHRAPRARRLAYELIALVDKSAEQRIIPRLLNDPSLELRRDAVAMALTKATALAEKDNQSAVEAFRTALTAARDLDQIQDAAKALRDLGEEVDLPRHFGFVMTWWIAGPFDNSGTKGFDVAYAPENKTIDLRTTYQGKTGDVVWSEHSTTDEFGMVDLAKLLNKEKGAVAYAYVDFVADEARDVELRLGCINANKVWLNGKLLTANHVYHANTAIDQYVGKGQLKKGRNSILLKICQNEQEESWAQRWQFQLRVCDQYGTAVLSQNRPIVKTTAASESR